jgi:hypothetical protein
MEESNPPRARDHAAVSSTSVGAFFIDVQDGRVATRGQLEEAGIVPPGDAAPPPRPWHPIQGPGDASTMWYAVMRKRLRGVFIGMLCIRHTDRQASMEADGWEEVPVAQIGVGRQVG